MSTISSGDTAWVLASSALVMLMLPGLGYFYSGLAQHKNVSALSLIFISMLTLAIVSLQWFFWGFSLAFSPAGGPVIGDFKYAMLFAVFEDVDGGAEMVVGDRTYPGIPSIPLVVFMAYQSMFAAITPALAFGGAAERSRIIPYIVFLLIWTTVVYDFIAYWTWAPNGWLRVMGSLDFAGGTPVHVASGAAALAYAFLLKKRHGFGEGDHSQFRPHNLSSVFLGTGLLWFGWFGFNAGSELAANARSGVALINTNLAAASGAITWVFLDYSRHGRKFSAFAFCSGAIAGLVAITPGGFVPLWSAPIFGVVTALGCAAFISMKVKIGLDDALDAFGVHGVGGLLGNVFTGVFASKRIAGINGAVISGGWIDGYFVQVPIQLAASAAGFAWSFVLTYVILFAMNKVPYLNLRLAHEKEMMGMDKSQLGDSAYDYIEMAVSTRGHGSEIDIQSLHRARTLSQTTNRAPLLNALLPMPHVVANSEAPDAMTKDEPAQL